MVAILTDRARAVAIIITITRGLPLGLRQGLWQLSWRGIITTITRGLPLGLRQGLWQWSWLGIITTITRGLPLGLRTTPPSL
jgi:hypothetical protein